MRHHKAGEHPRQAAEPRGTQDGVPDPSPGSVRPDALTATDVAVVLDGTPIVHDVGLTVRAGGWLSVIGPNGAGKSTLLRALAGLLPYTGTVTVDGAPTHGMSPRERARVLAYAPQTPQMPPDMTVFDYVLLGRTPHLRYFAGERQHDRDAAGGVLDRLDLGHVEGRRLGSLSGGERQQVVLARALAQEATVLLLDEPTTALDLGHQQQVLELVDRLRHTDGLTVLTTLHDLSLAAQYADELLLMDGGRAVANGIPRDVLTERAVATHYGARVRVELGTDGRPQVHLVREARPRD